MFFNLNNCEYIDFFFYHDIKRPFYNYNSRITLLKKLAAEKIMFKYGPKFRIYIFL